MFASIFDCFLPSTFTVCVVVFLLTLPMAVFLQFLKKNPETGNEVKKVAAKTAIGLIGKWLK